MRRRPGYFLSWIDMLYGQLATFFFLFVLSFLLINPPQVVNPGTEMKAEFLIRMEWPKTNFDDVDVHLLLPSGKHLHFKNKQIEYASIDHDDLGTSDVFVYEGKTYFPNEHKETIAIRAIVPGRYVVNVHLFRVTAETHDVKSDPVLPYNVHLKLTKLNPRVDDLIDMDLMMHEVGEQRTAFCFTVLENGFAKIDKDCDVPFIELKEFDSSHPSGLQESDPFGGLPNPLGPSPGSEHER